MTCEALSQGDIKCGRGGDHPYFWFNDSEQVFEKKFEICQSDSQEIFGRLLRTEYILKNTIDSLDKKIRNARVGNKRGQGQILHFSIQERSRENENLKRKQAKEISESTKNIKIWSEKKISLWKILNNLRNKTCRLCGHELECDCLDCKKRQSSNRYSTADLHSYRGFIREKIMFHTLCGRIWVLQTMYVDPKLKQQLLPSKTGQYTIEQSLSITDLNVS